MKIKVSPNTFNHLFKEVTMTQSPRNIRNKLTNQMMERVYARSQGGQAVDEVMLDIAQDPQAPLELRFKAAAKVADLIFPRASSVEMEIDVGETLSGADIDTRILDLLKGVQYAQTEA